MTASNGSALRAAQMIQQAYQVLGLSGALEELVVCTAVPELKGALRRCLQEVRGEEKLLSISAPAVHAEEGALRIEGTVLVFKEEGGYGFIGVAGQNQKDIFVHRTAVRGGPTSLHEGQRVRFSVVPGAKGPQANDVEILA